MTVTQPRVPVTGGRSALLPCRLEEGEAAQVTWYREGVAVKANLSAEAVMFGQYYVIYQAGRWYNLSIGEYSQLHSVEKREILCHQKNISSNQLFSNLFSKIVTFTEFLPKMREREFP